jgi:hypothetical protein
MKDWHKLRPELFRKQPYYLPGCDTYAEAVRRRFFELASDLSAELETASRISPFDENGH